MRIRLWAMFLEIGSSVRRNFFTDMRVFYSTDNFLRSQNLCRFSLWKKKKDSKKFVKVQNIKIFQFFYSLKLWNKFFSKSVQRQGCNHNWIGCAEKRINKKTCVNRAPHGGENEPKILKCQKLSLQSSSSFYPKFIDHRFYQ